MDKTIKASSTTAPSSYSSLSSAYPSSISSVSPPRLSSASKYLDDPSIVVYLRMIIIVSQPLFLCTAGAKSSLWRGNVLSSYLLSTLPIMHISAIMEIRWTMGNALVLLRAFLC